MTLKQTRFFIFATTLVAALAVSSLFMLTLPVNAANNGCETDTAIIKCENVNNSGELENTGLWSILNLAINILTTGVAILAVGGIVYASIIYATAGGNDSQVVKAKDMIRNVVIGIVAYALMYAFLNYIVPGGVFA